MDLFTLATQEFSGALERGVTMAREDSSREHHVILRSTCATVDIGVEPWAQPWVVYWALSQSGTLQLADADQQMIDQDLPAHCSSQFEERMRRTLRAHGPQIRSLLGFPEEPIQPPVPTRGNGT
jgi:hypothetical protein